MSEPITSPDGTWLWNGAEWIPNTHTVSPTVQGSNVMNVPEMRLPVETKLIEVDFSLLAQCKVVLEESLSDSGGKAKWYDRNLRISFCVPPGIPKELRAVFDTLAEDAWILLEEGDHYSTVTDTSIFDSNTQMQVEWIWNELRRKWYEREKTIYLGNSPNQQKKRMKYSLIFLGLFISLWIYSAYLEAEQEVSSNVFQLFIIIVAAIGLLWLLREIVVFIFAQGLVHGVVTQVGNSPVILPQPLQATSTGVLPPPLQTTPTVILPQVIDITGDKQNHFIFVESGTPIDELDEKFTHIDDFALDAIEDCVDIDSYLALVSNHLQTADGRIIRRSDYDKICGFLEAKGFNINKRVSATYESDGDSSHLITIDKLWIQCVSRSDRNEVAFSIRPIKGTDLLSVLGGLLFIPLGIIFDTFMPFSRIKYFKSQMNKATNRRWKGQEELGESIVSALEEYINSIF